MKAVHGLWQDIRVGQLNRILKPFGVRLVVKTSKEWGKAVTVTAHELEPVATTTVGCEHKWIEITGGQECSVCNMTHMDRVECDHDWVKELGAASATCIKCGDVQPGM